MDDSEPVSLTYDSMAGKNTFLDMVLKDNDVILTLRFHRPFWCYFEGFADCSCCKRPSVHDISGHSWEDVGVFVIAYACTEGFHFLCRDVEVLSLYRDDS